MAIVSKYKYELPERRSSLYVLAHEEHLALVHNRCRTGVLVLEGMRALSRCRVRTVSCRVYPHGIGAPRGLDRGHSDVVASWRGSVVGSSCGCRSVDAHRVCAIRGHSMAPDDKFGVWSGKSNGKHILLIGDAGQRNKIMPMVGTKSIYLCIYIRLIIHQWSLSLSVFCYSSP